MESSEVKINETHVCILKKNGNLIFVEYYPLIFEFEGELNKLESMASNPNRKSYELDDFIFNSPLIKLTDNFFSYFISTNLNLMLKKFSMFINSISVIF